MKNNNKFSLIIMTIVLLVGFVVAIGVWRTSTVDNDGCYVNNTYYNIGDSFSVETSQGNKVCVCNNNGSVDCSSDENLENNSLSSEIPDISLFSRNGLTFDATLLNKISTEVANINVFEVSEVNLDSSFFRVNIIENQPCGKDGNVIKQVGFYYYDTSKKILYLTSMINEADSDITLGYCRVHLSFNILGLKIPESSIFIKFVREDELYEESLCIYDKHIYKDGDAFQAVDGCNVCSCVSGKVKCEDNNMCKDSVKPIQSAYSDYPNSDRYELPEKDGECSKDSQCYVSGCNNEVCSGSKSVTTTCEVIPIIEDANCKCVQSKCLWVK